MKPYLLTQFTMGALLCFALQPMAAAADATAGKAAPADEKFLMNAAQGGMLEVELGTVAKEKATRAEVKDFGSMMASDHSKANADLKAVAAKNGVAIPAELDAKHKAMVTKMSKLSGAEFDKAYVDEMVKDHQKDVGEFEKASKSSNADVKDFAEKTLPVLKMHLEKVKGLAGK